MSKGWCLFRGPEKAVGREVALHQEPVNKEEGSQSLRLALYVVVASRDTRSWT